MACARRFAAARNRRQLCGAENPRTQGTLKLEVSDLYCGRFGDYRIVYQTRDAELVILIVRLGRIGSSRDVRQA